jgi:hypothetical protein
MAQTRRHKHKSSTAFALPIALPIRCRFLFGTIVFRVGVTFLSTLGAFEIGCESIIASVQVWGKNLVGHILRPFSPIHPSHPLFV